MSFFTDSSNLSPNANIPIADESMAHSCDLVDDNNQQMEDAEGTQESIHGKLANLVNDHEKFFVSGTPIQMSSKCVEPFLSLRLANFEGYKLLLPQRPIDKSQLEEVSLPMLREYEVIIATGWSRMARNRIQSVLEACVDIKIHLDDIGCHRNDIQDILESSSNCNDKDLGQFPTNPEIASVMLDMKEASHLQGRQSSFEDEDLVEDNLTVDPAAPAWYSDLMSWFNAQARAWDTSRGSQLLYDTPLGCSEEQCLVTDASDNMIQAIKKLQSKMTKAKKQAFSLINQVDRDHDVDAMHIDDRNKTTKLFTTPEEVDVLSNAFTKCSPERESSSWNISPSERADIYALTREFFGLWKTIITLRTFAISYMVLIRSGRTLRQIQQRIFLDVTKRLTVDIQSIARYSQDNISMGAIQSKVVGNVGENVSDIYVRRRRAAGDLEPREVKKMTVERLINPASYIDFDSFDSEQAQRAVETLQSFHNMCLKSQSVGLDYMIPFYYTHTETSEVGKNEGFVQNSLYLKANDDKAKLSSLPLPLTLILNAKPLEQELDYIYGTRPGNHDDNYPFIANPATIGRLFLHKMLVSQDHSYLSFSEDLLNLTHLKNICEFVNSVTDYVSIIKASMDAAYDINEENAA